MGGSCGMAVSDPALRAASRTRTPSREEGRDRRPAARLGPRLHVENLLRRVDALVRLPRGRRRSRSPTCCARRTARCPTSCTPTRQTVHDAIGVMREYGVSVLPVVGAEPPVKIGEVAGAVTEAGRSPRCSPTTARSPNPSRSTWASPCRSSAWASVDSARSALEPTLLVVGDGDPVGVITRHDLLGFISGAQRRAEPPCPTPPDRRRFRGPLRPAARRAQASTAPSSPSQPISTSSGAQPSPRRARTTSTSVSSRSTRGSSWSRCST